MLDGVLFMNMEFEKKLALPMEVKEMYPLSEKQS